MIDPKTLRIGNYIHNSEVKKPLEVIQIKQKRNSNKEMNVVLSGFRGNYLPHELFPIKLNEDIFLNCGFEKCSDNEHWFIGHVGFCLCFDGEDWCIKTVINDNKVVGYIKNLHEIQNWFYLLSGKELEINL